MFKSTMTVLFLFLLFNSNAAAQGESVEVFAKLLLSAVNKAETHVMFNIKEGKLYILDQDRKTLYPKNYQAPDYEVFTVYTIDQVKNYIKQARTKKIKLTKDFSGSVTFGDDGGMVRTLGDSRFPCPPGCPPNY